MIWNCPHCATVVSLAIEIDQVKRAYVRCASCKGVALIATKAIYADAEADAETDEETNADADSSPDLMAPPKPVRATIEDDFSDWSQEMTPPAFTHVRDSANAPAGATSAIENRTLAPASPEPIAEFMVPPPFRMPAPAAFATVAPIPVSLSSSIPRSETSLPPTREASAVKKTEAVAAPIPAATVSPKPVASAVHQFEFRETAQREASRIYQFPKAPEFLTRQEELVQGAFQTVNETPTPPASRKPLSIAVVIAACIAILSGVYLFAQGQKILQESRRVAKPTLRFSQTEPAVAIADEKPKAGALRPLSITVKVPRAVLRSGPVATAAALNAVKENDVLVVKSQQGDWYQVTTKVGQAWIRREYVEIL